MNKKPIVWKLFLTYWTSKNRWRGLAMLMALLTMSYFEIWAVSRFTVLTGKLTDSLQKRMPQQFQTTLLLLTACIFAMVVSATLVIYVRQILQMDWRTTLTDSWVGRWLRDEVIYRVEREQQTDNPDQRIAEDIRLFVEQTLTLGLGLVTAVLGLGTFLTALWQKSGPLDIHLGGTSWSIPGYLVWLCLLYALANTWLTRWVGQPLIKLTQEQQHVEADFRFTLIQVREHAEQVALYRGAATEHERLSARFEAICKNWRSLIGYQFRLSVFSSTTAQISSFFMYIVLAPRVFSGELSIGNLATLQVTFLLALNSLSWFANSWSNIVVWMAIVKRLDGLDRAIDAPPIEGIVVARREQSPLSATDLALNLPNGSALADIDNFSILPAQRWLVRGPSGAGKSTLLRAIAGLWPYGRGRIDQPHGSLLFLPQKSYLPMGSLKATLAYPAEPDAFSDEACRQALTDCRLGALAHRLADETRWEQQLSPGEQQRLAFARALLIRPDFLFLDESTSALDNATEQHLYQLLLDRLPHTALISVAHRTTLNAFHTHQLHIAAAGEPQAASA